MLSEIKKSLLRVPIESEDKKVTSKMKFLVMRGLVMVEDEMIIFFIIM